MRDYKTLDELLKADINFITEYGGFYYVKTKPEYHYENCIWKVDKKTGRASYMMFTEYIVSVADNAKPVNPSDLRRVS